MEEIKGYSRGMAVLVFFMAALFILGCGDKGETPVPDEDGTPPSVTVPDELKIISFNILEGMKGDRPANYDNFVNWVKTHDPDILAIQEANGFRQESLEQLAARFGHPYVITNLKATDNYPVALTSKYPLESRRRVTMHVSHGAIFAKLKDRDFNIVVTHLWPQSYWHTPGDGLGNDYRLHEINVILDSTVRKFPGEPHWILVGDFNAVSRRDFSPEVTTNNYWVTDQIEAEGFKDAIHHLHGTREENAQPYDFRYPGRRIDFIFASQPLLGRLIKAHPIYDDFVDTYSDHPAMYMEVSLK
ncbi:endonuclease/exonuclease/phosphatase family protein [Parapedobacter composti]|nr:endonuclease/exonuclease/phosphatase family protein [Parapedobacter composti]